MLFTFPSRYWSAIGLSGVFSLAGWSRLIHAEFLVLRATQDTTKWDGVFAYQTVTVYGRTFQIVPLEASATTAWSYNPVRAVTRAVWALPRSLATTGGITFVFFSCGY